MGSMVLAQLRRRRGRSVALLLGVLLATTGFTVLTGTVQAARLQVVGEVSQHFRGAYDIMVRPGGGRTQLEEQRGLVAPNFLGSLYSGITIDDWQRIAALPGVDVAAPVAMLGNTRSMYVATFDITAAIDPALTSQVVRLTPAWYGDAGLSRIEDERPIWSKYITRNPVAWPVRSAGHPYSTAYWDPEFYSGEYTDGVSRAAACLDDLVGLGQWYPPYEILPDGREVPICLVRDASFAWDDLPDVLRLTDEGLWAGPHHRVERLAPQVIVPIVFQVAAVDPVAEARLVGLDSAVTWGEALTPRGPVTPADTEYLLPADETESVPAQAIFPGLLGAAPRVDEATTVAASRVTVDLAGLTTGQVESAVATAPAADRYEPSPMTALAGWQWMVGHEQMTAAGPELYRSGAVRFDVTADGTLVPRTRPPAWTAEWEAPGWRLPAPFQDAAVRSVQRHMFNPPSPYEYGVIAVRGGFDPDQLQGFDPLAGAPLDTYAPDTVTGADASSRERLHGASMGPTSNPGGYLLTPPSLLVSVWALPWLDAANTAPIGAVRVRVAGIEAFDDVARERVRVVADQIAAMGFDVDVMLGSSAAPQTVALPAGDFGRPALLLSQMWTRLGVAAGIIEAVDHKSAVLFGLILVVCAFALGNAVMAAVRSRQPELAVLSCVGWSRRRIAVLVLSEVLLVGLTAGLASAALAAPLSALLQVELTLWRSLLAVPVALALCLAAAAVPVWRASRVHPAAALRPTTVAGARRRLPVRGVWGMALAGLARVPGRALVAAGALTVGIAGLTVLVAVTWAFRGTITGSVLGDAVSVQVRGVDVVAIAAIVLFGLFSVADVLYLNINERAAEHAAVRALGWPESAVARLVVYEGLGIGVVGAVCGAGLGLLAAAGLAGSVTPRLLAAAGFTAALAVVLSAVAALVPAALQRRTFSAGVLAADA